MEKLLRKDYINKLRILIVLICFILLLSILYIIRPYRPYTYKEYILFKLIVDSFPSLLFTIIITQLSFVYNSIKNKKFYTKLQILAIGIGLILTEVSQIFTAIGTFDLLDIVAIIIAIPIVILIEKVFEKINNKSTEIIKH